MATSVSSLNHVGIVNRDEAQAVSFYRDFLGLTKTREFLVATELSDQLFSLLQEIKVLVFEQPGTKIEVFIFPGFSPLPQTIAHFGLTVVNLDEFVARATRREVEVTTGKHEEKTVYFVKDFSGNLIEIKQG